MSLMLVGCAKEQTEDTGKASMELNPTELNFDAAASSKTVKVTCNRDWKVAEADVPEWVSLTVDGKDIKGVSQKASSNPVVTVTVLENTGYERACNIKFNGGTLATKTLTVKQAGNASYTTIAEVRALNPDKSAKVNAPEGTIVKGIVISNATLNNFNSKALVYVQDATAGICIKCSANHEFVFGDEVLVDLSGVSLEYYSNLFQANGVALDKISTLSSGKTPEVVQVSVADFLAGKYESRYVELNEDVQVVEADLSKNWVVGGNHTSIKMETKSGSNFIVQSSKYSSFKDTKVSQGSGKIKGIATVYNDQIQIAFAQLSDFAGLTGERFTIEVPKLETEKISEVIAAADNTEVTLKNVTVVAASITTNKTTGEMDTFMVEDTEHARLLIFEAPLGTIGEGAITVGDVVTVKGARTTYQGTAQLATPTVTKTGTGSVQYPAVKDITSELDTYQPKAGDYVKFTGKLNIDGNYYNVSVDGATTVIGAFNKPKFIDVTSYNDVPNVTYTGYYLYHTSKGKYLYIIVTDVKASDAPYLNVTPEKIDVNASATSAQFNVNSNIESWTCSVDNGASVNVTSGSKSQPVTVTFEANTDTENAKTYTVTVKGGDITKTVTITQKAVQGAGSIELTFPDENNENNKVSAYDKTWTAKIGDDSFSIVNFNNNNWNNWTYIKCGRKSAASVANIVTDAALSITVSKVVVTIDNITKVDKVKSTKLEVSTSKNDANVQTVDVTIKVGENEYVVPTPAANLFYRLTFDCESDGSANGIIQISKVTYQAK